MLKYSALISAVAAVLILAGCSSGKQEIPMAANYSVHKVFGDHMVLQRRQPIRISGNATPDAKVFVELADESSFAIAGDNGEWEALLPPMEAGGPFTLKISGATGSFPLELQDVLIGDVWLASGQSNMEMPVYSNRKYWSTLNGKEEAAMANYPKLRLYNASSQKYVSPAQEQDEVRGPGWQVCAPDTIGPFSAVAFYFGRQLQKDLDVPIGLISASWGGTPIQPWISYGAYQRANRLTEIRAIENFEKDPDKRAVQIKTAIAQTKKDFSEWLKRFYGTYKKETEAAETWKNLDYVDAGWQRYLRLDNSFPSNAIGVAWYRKSIELPASMIGKELTLSLGVIDDCDETYFNGVKVGSTGPEIEGFWKAKRVYKIPGNLVHIGRNLIAIRVSNLYDGGGLQTETSEMFVQCGDEKLSLDGEWRFNIEFIADTDVIGKRPQLNFAKLSSATSPDFPATLFNSMIHPWINYPICGVLWYQGESNANQPQDYIELQKLLISDMRTRWNNPRLPFLFVQLSGFERHTPDKRLPDDFWVECLPGNPSWAAFREAQAATLSEPYTGMAVCIDAGDHSDIHPANKQIVGFRLAKEAERIHYGQEIVSSGPFFRSMKIDKDKVIVSFNNVGGGLVASDNKVGKLNCFAIAGKDGVFVWADAIIDGYNKVIVSSPFVKEPTAIRYAWVSYAGNLNFYNAEGFPAVPFRTDKPAYID
ncbi:MAG: sialate O-acetylesterase [Victivallales bacterium]|jgi:sialate O-acetylesterase|nr:sialate O-acetylesterase [Victivallales bacterium]